MPELFKRGKLTFVLDGGAGSSAKGQRGAYIWKNHKENHTTLAINTFMSNAAHTITHADGKEVIHQCLSSITTLGNYDRQYISPGSVFAKNEIIKEIELCKETPTKLGIHPNAVIVTENDINYEKGLVDFEGNKKSNQDSINLRIGSTLHGVGAARARRILRRPDVVLAKDIKELQPFICQTHEEILERLSNGESGLGEIAQGYQLSLMSKFYPKTTSRNCSVSAFLDDSLLPPSVVGPVVLNYRTFPIRVNNNKYIRKSDGKILTWDGWNSTADSDKTMLSGDSGGMYADQQELTWDEISKNAGKKILEQTSLTKLPRRVFTFSKINLLESLIHNNTGDDVYISINFMNYVDSSIEGKRSPEIMTNKVVNWLNSYVFTPELTSATKKYNIKLKGLFISTGKIIDDSIFVDANEFRKYFK